MWNSMLRGSAPCPKQHHDSVGESSLHELKDNQSTSTDFFGAHATRWLGLYGVKPAFMDRLELFTDSVKSALPDGTGRVLDFGCGPGVIAMAIAESGYDVVGMDGAELMIETARKEQARRGIENAEFRVMDAREFSIPPESFDAVVCSSVIEYVEDDAALVKKLIGTLRPGGRLVISVPNAASLIGKTEDLLRDTVVFARRAGGQHLGYSRRRYRRVAFLKLLQSLGLGSFACTSFEVPVLGRAGVAVSRLKRVGVMLLVVGRKGAPDATADHCEPRRTQKAISRKNLWEEAPRAVRRLIGRPLSLLPRRALLGRGFRQSLDFVEEAQWWPADKSRDYQLAQVRRVCQLAYERSAFYAKHFDEAGFDPRSIKTLDDLSCLPTIDRDDLRNNIEAIYTRSPDSRGVDCVSTGGTGGEPLRFCIGSDRSGVDFAYLVSSWQRVGYDLRTPAAVFRGRAVAEDSRGLRHEFDPILNTHNYSAFHMSDENMRRYLEHVRGLGPCVLHVYPSTVAMLARFMRRHSVARLEQLRGIIAESEIVYPQQRSMVEDVFGCRYFSCYGHSEKLVSAAECEHSTDYHIWPTYGYFELLDDKGCRISESGRRGEIVGTGFINSVVPFIRYRTGDFATYVSDRCDACRREHVCIRDIEGHRTQEILVAADNSLIPWTALNMHDDTFAYVRRFQFRQEVPGRAVLRVVPGVGFGDEERKRIIKSLDAKLQGRLLLSVVLTDAIDVTPQGKAIYVDQAIEGIPDGWGGEEPEMPLGERRPAVSVERG